jgi:hypothetical protein
MTYMNFFKQISTTALFAFLMALHSAAEAQVAGLEGVPWGSTSQEVAKKYPNFEEWEALEFDLVTMDWKQSKKYGLRSYAIAGCKWALALEFAENKLLQVILDQKEIDRGSCRTSALTELLSRYGDKPEVSIHEGNEKYQWVKEDTTIVMRAEKGRNGAESILKVVYTNSVGVKEFMNDALKRRKL